MGAGHLLHARMTMNTMLCSKQNKTKQKPNRSPNHVSYTMSTVLKNKQTNMAWGWFACFQRLFVTPNSYARARHYKLTKQKGEESKYVEENEVRVKNISPWLDYVS